MAEALEFRREGAAGGGGAGTSGRRDGSFWMTFEDFLRHFRNVTMCGNRCERALTGGAAGVCVSERVHVGLGVGSCGERGGAQTWRGTTLQLSCAPAGEIHGMDTCCWTARWQLPGFVSP